MNADRERYFLKLAAAFVRGRCVQGHVLELSVDLLDVPLDDLAEDSLAALFCVGQAAGLEMHRFKRAMGLPRESQSSGHRSTR